MAMERISGITLEIEEILATGLLCLIPVLVFGSAVVRIIGVPISRVRDIVLLAFAWLIFLGTGVATRSGRLVNISVLTNQLPKVVQELLGIVFDMMMLLSLFVLIVYGFLLVSQSWGRMSGTLKFNYAWCTLAVSVGALLLFIAVAGMLVRDIREPTEDWGRGA